MFTFREDQAAGGRRVSVAFTDASMNLQGPHSRQAAFEADLDRLVNQTGVPFARLSQVHGDRVHLVDETSDLGPSQGVIEADALVTKRCDVGLMIRVADCVPIVLADPAAGVIGAVHSGRQGMALDITARTVEAMREHGARDLTAWIGPHVCGGCYEVPDNLRDEVAELVPAAHAQTRWGTASLDLGAGVRSQLEAAGVDVVDASECTLENQSLHSYRRDGASSGRFAGLVWMSEAPGQGSDPSQ